MPVTLKQLADAAKALVRANANVADIMEKLKAAKEAARLLSEETIPAALQELGVTTISLESGEKIIISQEVYASIPKDKKDDAFKWLNANGFGGLIKTIVKTSFGKGERDVALELARRLYSDGLDAAFEENVHPSTLKAFLKEQIKTGQPVPLHLFGARPIMTTKIK